MLIKLLNMVYKNLVMVNINKKEKYKTNTICTIKFNYKVENYSKLIYNINITFEKGSVTMSYLIRATETDYRDYRKAYLSVRYSFDVNGSESESTFPEDAYNFYKEVVLSNKKYIKLIKNPKNHLYFFRNDKGENMGYLLYSSTKSTCFIKQFGVFEQGKRHGTQMFIKLLELLRENEIRSIELWCPFLGAQEFWKKMGFYLQYENKCEFKKNLK